HGQRIHSLEANANEVDQRLQQLEDACSALKGDNETLKMKVADLEGRSTDANIFGLLAYLNLSKVPV
ncbi:hypothetical protein KUCAC02_031327, partial [Chaenocephalus aceratus]